MKIDVLKDRLLDEWLLEEAASKYIQNLRHASKFVQCFVIGFQSENQNSEYDFVEVLDCNQVEIVDIEFIDDRYEINFIFDYVLTVWRSNKQLARITASAKGECFCIVEENDRIDSLVIKELYNQCEEYDDCTVYSG